ncbi:hypothetical protein H9P43_008324 [Blastocladiella emersonii ATCC 22665]|nr:hypothetical protein H9P43_008324 [Blastocladiella emersonii ATCC 22665]
MASTPPPADVAAASSVPLPPSPSVTTASPPAAAVAAASASPATAVPSVMDVASLKEVLAAGALPPMPPVPAEPAATDALPRRRRSVVSIVSSSGTVLHPEDADFAFELTQTLDSVYHDDEIKAELQSALHRACGAGDLRKVSYLLKHCANDVAVDARDEAGTTGLMQAACFGHLAVVKHLVEAGADKNLQDNNGWTALMWATNNNRDEVVEFLLDQGVDPELKSRSGRTVRDFLERAHLPQREKLASIFFSDTRSTYTRRSSGSEGSLGAATSITSLTSESYYVPSLYGVDYREMCKIVGTTVPAQLVHVGRDVTAAEDLQVPDMVDPQVFLNEEEEGLIDFSWESCPPDQMFVFSEKSLDHLLHVAIRRLSDPAVIRSQNNNPAGFTRRPVSANVLFLAARYAGYYGSPDLLDRLFTGAFDLLEQVLRPKRHDMMFLGYWLANCSRLLYFLKKDGGLVVATLQYQVRLNELIQDIFMALLRDAQQRLSSIVDEALLNHDTIPGYSSIKFRERKVSGVPGGAGAGAGLDGGAAPEEPQSAASAAASALASGLRRVMSSPNVNANLANGNGANGSAGGAGGAAGNGSGVPEGSKLSSINRLSSYFSSTSSLHGGRGASNGKKRVPGGSHGVGGKRTPKTVTTVLSSTLYVLQTFQIHPSLVHQAIEQLFFYLGAATFNRLLSRPELCCRWKAMQIRMNLSHLEDWVRSNPIPAPSRDSFTRHLQPVISMLQLLQILTHFKSLDTFIEALRESEHLAILNWSQLRRALDQYTYEDDENPVAPAIADYIARCAQRAQDSAVDAVRDVENDEGMFNGPQSPMGFGAARRTSLAIDLSITANMGPSSGGAGHHDGAAYAEYYDPLASPPLSPPPLDDNGMPVYSSPRSSPAQQQQQQRNRRVSVSMHQIKGPVVAVSAFDAAHGRQYTYFMLDEKYWLPFAVPTNVGERLILRIVDGDESYIEEAPVLTTEIVGMLDGKC